MITLACACLALVAGLPAPSVPDTTVAVRPGDLLVAETPSGVLSVRVWERNEVRVEGGTRGVRRDGATLRLTQLAQREARREVVVLTVPRWMDLRVTGRTLDVDITGVEGRVTVGTLAGDLRLTDTGGEVQASSVAGNIVAEGVRGSTRLSAVDGWVEVRRATGRLSVSSTDGDLTLTEIAVEMLEAETTDGDVAFEGRILPGSRLRLATHDGHVDVGIPADADVDVSVSTFDGAFHPEFPVQARGLRAGEALRFALGRGGATLDIWAFDGDIRLRHITR